jgi:hypothetical protein
MTPRSFHALMAVLIRIGLLLALAIMLIAENVQAHAFTGQPAGASAATHIMGDSPVGAASLFCVDSSARQRGRLAGVERCSR